MNAITMLNRYYPTVGLLCLLTSGHAADSSTENGAVVSPPAPVTTPSSGGTTASADEGYHHLSFLGAELQKVDGPKHLPGDGIKIGYRSTTDLVAPHGGFMRNAKICIEYQRADVDGDQGNGFQVEYGLTYGYGGSTDKHGWAPFGLLGGEVAAAGVAATSFNTSADEESHTEPTDYAKTDVWGRAAATIDLGVQINSLGFILISSHTEYTVGVWRYQYFEDVPTVDDPTVYELQKTEHSLARGRGVETGIRFLWLLGTPESRYGYSRIELLALTTVSGDPGGGNETRYGIQIDVRPFSIIGFRAFAMRREMSDLTPGAVAYYRASSSTDTRYGVGVGFSW
jgi:hypothetical protein